MSRSTLAIVAALLVVLCARTARSQTPATASTVAQGGFPDASFTTSLRKHTPPRSALSPFYSWDARMAIDATAFRRNAHAFNAVATIQSIGTENLGSKIGGGATGYLVGFG